MSSDLYGIDNGLSSLQASLTIVFSALQFVDTVELFELKACSQMCADITHDVGLIYSLCFPEMLHCQFCSSHIVIVPAGTVMLFSPAAVGAVFDMLQSLHSS